MSEQERERIIKEGEEPESDVEGHLKRRSEGAEAAEGEAGMRREGDDPDVEGHLKR
jgi:hypothetical protein